MTEEIINADGSRNWQANILLDNVKRLEQENKELKETVKDLNQSIQNCNIQRTKMYKTLEEIRKKCNWVNECSVTNDNLWEYDEILEIINEVLNEN